MRFPAEFLEDLKASVPISRIAAKRVKLKKAGHEWVGLSPFGKERTPSFYCNDAKAMFFDHSAKKEGNVFQFVMWTEGVPFEEAVERIAREAGLPLPQRDAETMKREAHKLDLVEVLQCAATIYQENLQSPAGKVARDYLLMRGVTRPAIDRFRLGYALADRSALKQRLAGEGMDQAMMVEAGLVIAGDDTPVTYDRFRGRLMFPIIDVRNQVLGFGGRTMEKDVQPKYLNSPEGPTFNKGGLLYNYQHARQPAHDGADAVLVEGYMDVVACDAAGYPATVGSMGTALTGQQCRLLWGLASEPVVCFDGDKAGRQAVRRALKIAFAQLEPGRSLHFAMVPPGSDPDDVVRNRGGAEALDKILRGAIPMMTAFWRSYSEGRTLVTPEQREGLGRDMGGVLGTIPNKALREDYERDMRDRLNAVPARPRVLRSNGASQHSASPGSLRLVHGLGQGEGISLAEGTLIAAMVASPATVGEVIEEISSSLDVLSPEARGTVGHILNLIAGLPNAQSVEVLTAAKASAFGPNVDRAYSLIHNAGIRSLEPGGSEAVARAVLKRH